MELFEILTKPLSLSGAILEVVTTVGLCALVAAALGALVLFVRAVVRNNPVVESIAVTHLLEERGWTGAIVAQRLIDRTRALAESVQVPRDPVEFLRRPEHRDYVQIKGGGVEVSLQSLVRATRELFRLGDTKISGE